MAAPKVSDRRVILQQTLGMGGIDPLTRWCYPYLVNNGWEALVTDIILPSVQEYNIKRVLLNRPFGQVKTQWPGNPTVMEFDAYSQCVAGNCWNQEEPDGEGNPVPYPTQDLSYFYDGFGAAMALLSPHVDEIIGYIGSPRYYRTDLQAHWDNGWDQTNWEAWKSLVMDELVILLDAGCTIGYDATTCSYASGLYVTYAGQQLEKIGGREAEFPYLLTRHLESLGHRVYWEPWIQRDNYVPGVDDSHCYDVPRILLEAEFYDPVVNAEGGHERWLDAATAKPLIDEVVRWHLMLGVDPGDRDAEVQAVLDDGDTIVLTAHHIAGGYFSDDLKTEYGRLDQSPLNLSLTARGSLNVDCPVRGTLSFDGPISGQLSIEGQARGQVAVDAPVPASLDFSLKRME